MPPKFSYTRKNVNKEGAFSYKVNCAMRCCNRDWVKQNKLSDVEVRHFKKLADDMLGFMLHCGYSPLDFPSILHVFATFTAPGVLEAYRRAEQYAGEELQIREIMRERALINREYREHQRGIIRELKDEQSPLVSKIKERRGKALRCRDYEPLDPNTIKIEAPKNEVESKEVEPIPPRRDISPDLGKAGSQASEEAWTSSGIPILR